MTANHPLQPFVDSGEIVRFEAAAATKWGNEPYKQHYKVFIKNLDWQERERLRGRLTLAVGHTFIRLIDVDTGEALE